ncbi:MAG: TauD/TfdA family dioxygenase [Alphaproteobacteria bacterium]
MVSNPFVPARRGRQPATLGRPVVDPAAWRAEEFKENLSFVYQLASDEVAEILAAVERVEKSGIALKDVTRHEFDLPRFGKAMDEVVMGEVMEGRGFIFLRGLPTEGRSVFQSAVAQWGLATYVGLATPQNAKGHLLEHVKNAGGNINAPTGRGYNSANALGFHADSCDAFSLMCLHGARAGGEHRIVSSITVYNEMLKRRPDLAEELTFRFYRTRRGEVPAGEDPFYRQPVFSVTDGYFSARGASSTIKRAQRLPGVPKLTDRQQEAIDYYQQLSGELSLFIDWKPGDISFVLNHVALHARTKYEDWPEADRRRHLLRLWLDLKGRRPIHAEIAREMAGIELAPGTELKTPMEMTPVAAG